MSVLRYCWFRWLVYDRALVFEPSRPLACIMMLVWLIYVLELRCDLPVSPWSWSYTFACMISVRSNWGRHKLVSEPTAYRNPPSQTPWPKLSLDIAKTFTNLAVCLTGPRRHWVVVGSFIPRPILWDSDISSIRVKWILLNLTLGSRYHFHPESPLLLMIVCCTWRPWRYSPLITRELVFIAFAIPFHR